MEPGIIVSQDPEAGTTVKTKSTITVFVSAGPGDGEVPDVLGQDEDSARDIIESAGFECKVTTQASEKTEGTIISQDPSGGSQAEKGSTVTLVASDGSLSRATMPYLKGKTLGEAQSLLESAGLKLGNVDYVWSDSYSDGEVMWQQYDAESKLDKNTSVNLQVSKGPKPTQATTTTTTEEPEPTDPSEEEEED